MNQLDALTHLLDATTERDDEVLIRRARKVVAKMAEKRRLVRQRKADYEAREAREAQRVQAWKDWLESGGKA